jgi:3'-phosphoadenosine 5'-phosphosulfate sulfotransferase (PAPS reductase)/FAD synthetase
MPERVSSNNEDEISADEWLAREGFDLSVLTTPQFTSTTQTGFIPDLASYDHILVGFSGGRDSVSCLLHLLDLGVPPQRIEAQHHLVDGREGSTLMDWPVTPSYCEAVCKTLGVALSFSWREGGMEREATRQNTPTAPIWIPLENGYRAIGGKGPLGTRMKFPQVSADLSVRWCSSSLKISTMDAYLRNHPKFLNRRTLVVTGERAEESSARARYKVFEPHRSDTRNSKRVPRHIDVWRAVHGWSESRIWDTIRRSRICPHPCYFIGFSRCSCRTCIFGNKHQWATVRAIAPEQFNQVASYEKAFRVTIHRTKNVVDLATAGAPYDFDPRWVEIANRHEFTHPVILEPWVLPRGAFGDGCGPT